jgi:hypothetical protein
MLQPHAAVASLNRAALQTAQAAALQNHSKIQAAASHTHQGHAARTACKALQPKRRAIDLLLRLRLRLRRAREIDCMKAAGFEHALTEITRNHATTFPWNS